MTGFLNGVATAMITPFTDSGVNFEEFGKMIEYQVSGGTDAIVILGTTGEPSTMTEEEKTEVIKYAVKVNAGRMKIICGAGSNDTKKAVAAARLAEELGADGILAVTPYYNKCTQNGLFEYYKAICSAVKIPVIAYNVPPRTGVNILPETMRKIAKLDNMAGVKEASGNMAQVCETMRLVRGLCDVYSGEDALNLPVLTIGGAGVISVVSNVAPVLVKAAYCFVQQGKLDQAQALQDVLLPLASACFCEVNPIPVKAAYNMLGFNAGVPRPPLTELEDCHKELLLNALKDAGLKKI